MRRRLLIRTSVLVGFLLAASLAPTGAVGSARAAVVDAVVGAVGATAMTASDIALARALELFGFTPSEAPIRSADVDRYAAGLIAALEASRLGIGPSLTEVDQAWTALEIQKGGAAALRAWLDAALIDPLWARRALEVHLRWRTWTSLHEGLTIETPGATPQSPGLDSDLVARNLLGPSQEIPVPFPMPRR